MVPGVGKTAFTKRFPIGVIAAITPFNFPLNLVLHKVAPAMAVGCPVVLKPAPQAPLSAFVLGQDAWKRSAGRKARSACCSAGSQLPKSS
jgi:acyl-CoA reductase-like NAD-dependent aldehyde dehydrogenase